MALYRSAIELDSITDLPKKGYIMFYAHWCPHCQVLVPKWNELYEKIGKEYSVKAIDCALDKNEETCRKYQVESYPTIKIWNPSTKTMTDYNGEREVSAWINAIKTGGGRKRRARKSTQGSRKSTQRARKSTQRSRKSTQRSRKSTRRTRKKYTKST